MGALKWIAAGAAVRANSNAKSAKRAAKTARDASLNAERVAKRQNSLMGATQDVSDDGFYNANELQAQWSVFYEQYLECRSQMQTLIGHLNDNPTASRKLIMEMERATAEYGAIEADANILQSMINANAAGVNPSQLTELAVRAGRLNHLFSGINGEYAEAFLGDVEIDDETYEIFIDGVKVQISPEDILENTTAVPKSEGALRFRYKGKVCTLRYPHQSNDLIAEAVIKHHLGQ